MNKIRLKGIVGLILFISGLALMFLSLKQNDNLFSLIGFIIMMCSTLFVDHKDDALVSGDEQDE